MNSGPISGGVAEEILESAGEAFVSIASDGSVRAWNLAAQRLFGFTREEALGRRLAELILPERHREAHLRGLARFLETGEERLVNRRIELEALHRDGRELPVELIITPLRLGDEVIFNAFLHDISARRRADLDLRRLAAVVESSQDAIVSGRPDGTIETWNAGAERLFGYTAGEMIGQAGIGLLPRGDSPAVREVRERVLAGVPVADFETREHRKDASPVDVSVSISPLEDADGRVVGLSSVTRDITARKEAEEELRRYSERLDVLSLQDPLTGLRSSAGLHTALDGELERSHRTGEVFAVALFNLDGFERLAEARGRRDADRMLRVVAAAMTAGCRSSDTPARIRGAQFALILPGTDEAGAQRTAERVSAEVAAGAPGLSLSFGVAGWPAAGDGREFLLGRAEMALHAARPEESAGDGGQAPSSEITERIERVLALVRRQLGMDLTFLGEFREDVEVFRAVEGDAASFGLEQGTELALSDTFCQRMADGRVACAVPDTAADAEVAGLAVTREAGIGSYVGVPLVLPDGRLYGALCGMSHAARELSAPDVELMRFLAELVAELLAQEELDVRRRRVQLETSGVRTLVAALEARDHYTGEHSRTVVRLTTAVARRLGLSEEQVLEAEQVGILHDIGKVGIPDQLLQKRGGLSDAEWELMRQHPAVGERMVASTENLAHLAPAIRAEHERYDGTGYPDRLRGEEIPIASRITLACDAYHAMTSDRPYRAALSAARARTELEANAGTQFDSRVVVALLEALDESPPGGDRPPAVPERRRVTPRWGAGAAGPRPHPSETASG